MNALVSSFLINALDPDTCLKLGMQSGAGLRGATADQLLDYMRPWALTAAHVPCRRVVLHDGLPAELKRKFAAIEFVECPVVKENAWLARYRHLADWLAGESIERLFFSDINDVGIYGDPFAWSESLPPELLLAGEEWTPFGANPWFTDAYPRMSPAWRTFYETRLATEYPLSAGLIGGRRDVVLAFVQRLVQTFHDQREQIAQHPMTAWDMLGLNYLLFTGGPFVGFKQNDLPAGHPLAGAYLRNSGSIQVYRPELPNPFCHDRKQVMDRLPMVYDSWCTSRVLEWLADHPQLETLKANFCVPRCWGDGPGHSPVDRTSGLAELVLTMFPADGRIVECGRGRGVSAELFALLRPNCEIISVDVAETPEASDRLQKYPNVTLVQADSVAWLEKQHAHSLAAVYLDSDHSFEHVGRELRACRNKLRRGGVLSGHDYCLLCPDVIRAVAEFFGRDNPPHRVTSDSSWGYVLL